MFREAKKRRKRMLAYEVAGFSLSWIATRFGISKQRVHQCVSKAREEANLEAVGRSAKPAA